MRALSVRIATAAGSGVALVLGCGVLGPVGLDEYLAVRLSQSGSHLCPSHHMWAVYAAPFQKKICLGS